MCRSCLHVYEIASADTRNDKCVSYGTILWLLDVTSGAPGTVPCVVVSKVGRVKLSSCQTVISSNFIKICQDKYSCLGFSHFSSTSEGPHRGGAPSEEVPNLKS